jgi:hypothetical protein
LLQVDGIPSQEERGWCGDSDVVSWWKNKVQSAVANVTPAGVLAELSPSSSQHQLT